MISTEISLGNLQDIRSSMRELGVDLRSLREPLKRAVQEVVLPSFAENFDAEGRPAWAAAARDYGHPLLNKTGKLKRGATVLANWDFDRESARLNPDYLISRIGVKIVHQTGYVRKTVSRSKAVGGKGIHEIPARPFIMIQAEDEEKIQQVFERYVAERVRRRWG